MTGRPLTRAANYGEQALHQNSSIAFKLALQQIPRVVMTDVAYQLRKDNGHAADGDLESASTADDLSTDKG